MDAQLDVDERETTNLVLQIVQVAERNGLKLPREFGLIVKQVCSIRCCVRYSVGDREYLTRGMKALYFDRYQKLLAPEMDPLRDASVRSQWLIDDAVEAEDPAERRGNGRLPKK